MQRKKTKNEVFGHFIGLSLFDWCNIVYSDENNIQVLMLIKMLGSVHKKARYELKAFLILFREVPQVDMVKWT